MTKRRVEFFLNVSVRSVCDAQYEKRRSCVKLVLREALLVHLQERWLSCTYDTIIPGPRAFLPGRRPSTIHHTIDKSGYKSKRGVQRRRGQNTRKWPKIKQRAATVVAAQPQRLPRKNQSVTRFTWVPASHRRPRTPSSTQSIGQQNVCLQISRNRAFSSLPAGPPPPPRPAAQTPPRSFHPSPPCWTC